VHAGNAGSFCVYISQFWGAVGSNQNEDVSFRLFVVLAGGAAVLALSVLFHGLHGTSIRQFQKGM
jgi:hypothetical protein